MKNTKRSCFLLKALALAFGSLTLCAAEPKEVPWNEVCRAAQGRELLVTTTTGSTVAGYCVVIDVNEIGVKTTDRGIVKVARTALSKLSVERARGHQLRSLGRGVHKGLHKGTEYLLSPMAPIGLVVVPATLAWGAFSAPFCVIGDLKAKAAGSEEIKPI
jgi:hypothetical protein